ncbi:FitA-like ribbon-helix-helix domain-containing protein [Saccharopolyspora sp. NPDC003752]
MTSVQVRNVPDDVMDALRAEAEEHGLSLQQHLLSVLEEHTARTRMRNMFAQLDAVLGDEPMLTEDAAEAVRELRDEQDARDADRAEGHS